MKFLIESKDFDLPVTCIRNYLDENQPIVSDLREIPQLEQAHYRVYVKYV